jgi:hypothetical protein
MRIPLVRPHGGVAQLVAPSWRRLPAYRQYRQQIDVRTYAQLVEALERLVTDPVQCASAAIDFAPTADYARRFLNSTVAFRTRPVADPRRQLAERAVRVLLAILTGTVTRPGRHANPPLSGQQVREIQRVHAAWLALVRKAWRQEDRCRLLLQQRFAWSASHRRALRNLLAKPGARPSDVAMAVTAWELRLSMRRVRTALRDTVADTLYA